MEVTQNILTTIATKYYTQHGREVGTLLAIGDLNNDIRNYFENGKRSRDDRLQLIIDNFDNPDNPMLKEKPEDSPGLGSWLWENIQTFFGEMFPAVWTGFKGVVSDIIDTESGSWVKKLIGIDAKNFDKFLDKLVKMGFLDNESRQNVKAMYAETGDINPLIWVFLLIALGFTFIQVMIGTVGGDYIKKQNTIYTPGVPSAESLISGLRIAPELKDRFIKAFKENGLSDKDIELMLISAYTLYDVNSIRELYLRGTITNETMIERMGELGFTPQRIADLVSLWELIPPVQDILFMVGKEAFEPEEVAKLGLGAEFPHAVSPWLSAQGLSQFWQEKYWAAHWAMPSMLQGFEMFHRRVIDEDLLNSLFKTVEIPPFWRDKLIEIAYKPFTRVDARRMHAMGSIDEQTLFDNYLDLGYSPSHAEKMTEWTITYNKRSDRNVTKEQIISAYRDDIINKNDARARLQSIGFTEDDANFTLNNVDYQIEKDRQDDIVDVIGDSYSSNLMERDEAISRLTALDLSPNKIDYLIQRWDVRKINNRKLPSKTDLKKLLENGIIGLDDYKEQLRIIGYEEKYINWFASLISLEGELNSG